MIFATMTSKRSRLSRVAILTAATYFVSASCLIADDSVITTMSSARIERIITSFKDVKNFKEIANNMYSFEADGLKLVIENKSQTLHLAAVFSNKVTLSRINEWNRTKRFTRAYLDKDNDPVLEGDIELTGGVTEKNVIEWIKTYIICLKAFQKHLSGD